MTTPLDYSDDDDDDDDDLDGDNDHDNDNKFYDDEDDFIPVSDRLC